MAAAALPVLAAAAPILLPIVQNLVMGVEHLFGAGTGPTKLDTVLKALTPVAAALSTAGTITGTLDAPSLTALVQSVVSNLKAQGVLNPSTAAIVAAQPVASSMPTSGTFQISGGTLQLTMKPA
jgi:hypothetical protein